MSAVTMTRRETLREQKRESAEAMLSALPAPDGEAGWAREMRARARARLLEAGAPIRRDEYWRFTDPSALTRPLRIVEAGDAGETALPFENLNPALVRFVNGRHRADLSADAAGEGVAMATLSETLSQDISIFRDIYGVLETAGQEKVDRPLAILNTATATEGLVIQVTGQAKQPIHIRYDQSGEGAALIRHLIRVEKGAEVTVLESGNASNTVLEAEIEEGAILHHIRLQTGPREPHATHFFAKLHANSQLKTFTLTADGELTRNEVVIDLVGDRGSGHIAGAILGKNAAHLDNTIFVTHTAEHCESRQVFKNVLTDRSVSAFQGKIFVRPDAQKTDAYQLSQSVLLEDGTEFLVKPELEIHADDVACSHGSTTGGLDPTAMFYLRSRGVPHHEAETMLIAAFADEAIEEIANEKIADLMRDEVSRWMAARHG